MPAATLSLTFPKMTTAPPVIYSHPLESHPSITDKAPEFLTANLSPALPDANNFPEVAPYNTVLPIIVFSSLFKLLSFGGRIANLAPDNPLPT